MPSTMINSYQYKNPQLTKTLEEFRACQSSDDPSYSNFSFKDEWYYEYLNENLMLTAYNVIGDYMAEIRDYCKPYTMTDEEFLRYKYRPKLFAFDKYDCLELGYMLLFINDMYSFKQFIKKSIIAPSKAAMKLLCQQIFNANKEAISYYNRQIF